MADVLRAFGLTKPIPGRPFYITEESGEKTYSAIVDADGTLSHVKLFAERGGESVAEDNAGNVYIAAGNILVYSPAGRRIGTIRVPERPVDLVFGGKNGRTLFILTHKSLYAVAVAAGSAKSIHP
jgi:sugar lactone lactonase YvrE